MRFPTTVFFPVDKLSNMNLNQHKTQQLTFGQNNIYSLEKLKVQYSNQNIYYSNHDTCTCFLLKPVMLHSSAASRLSSAVLIRCNPFSQNSFNFSTLLHSILLHKGKEINQHAFISR